MNEMLVCEECGEPLGITVEQYEKKLKEQDGKCPICGEELIHFCVSLDPNGKFRGLLCVRCSQVLEGWMKEFDGDLDAIIEYVENQIKVGE